MTVFWKIHRAHFNSYASKTTLDLAVERYAETGSPVDLERLQFLLASRRPMNANEMKPIDIVVNRVAATGNTHDFRMLQALVKCKRPVTPKLKLRA